MPGLHVIRLYGLDILATFEERLRCFSINSGRVANRRKSRDVSNIFAVDKIGSEETFNDIILSVILPGEADEPVRVDGIWGDFDALEVKRDTGLLTHTFNILIEALRIVGIAKF